MNTGFNSRLQSNEKGEAEECQGGREPGGGECAILMQALPSRCSFLLGTSMYFSSKHKLDFSPPDVDSNADTAACTRAGGFCLPASRTDCGCMKRPRTLKEPGLEVGGPMGIKETAPVFSLGAVSSAV